MLFACSGKPRFLFQKIMLVEPSAAFKDLGLEEHQLRFTCTVSLDEEGTVTDTAERIYKLIKA